MGLSFSLDFTTVFNMASQLISGLFPVFMVPLGIGLGGSILKFIAGSFRSII